MPDTVILMIVFAIGIGFLVAEIFIPSHGVLTLAGLGFLGYAIWRTFIDVGTTQGVISLIAAMILVPTLGVVAVKYFHRTPIGKMISPPNPERTDRDSGVDIQTLRRFVGKRGKAMSQLRPVGICDFDGKRISCVSQFGVIEPGSMVEAVGITGSNVSVVAQDAGA